MTAFHLPQPPRTGQQPRTAQDHIYQKYKGDGLTVFGVATAFEDYDKNTLENLEMLLTTGEVVGDTKQALSQYGQLDDGKLQFKIPYPVAMDSLLVAAGLGASSGATQQSGRT